MSILVNLVAEGETTHTGLNTEHIVVNGKHVHAGGTVAIGLLGHSDLRVINAREVAGTRGLVLLGLEREGVRVDPRVRVT